MAKSKEKKPSKKKTKTVETPIAVEPTPVVEEKRVVPKKNSLLPSSVAKPLEDLKRRVETLESAIANILLHLDKN